MRETVALNLMTAQKGHQESNESFRSVWVQRLAQVLPTLAGAPKHAACSSCGAPSESPVVHPLDKV